MSDEQIIEKDDWKTILNELDELVRELSKVSSMAMGDKTSFEEEMEFPALIHFISELKKEKKNQSWEKIENFTNKVKDNLKLLEETQQIKLQGKIIDRSFIGVLPKNTSEIGKQLIENINEIPNILKIINESVEAMLIDIKLKLGFPIIKLEKEILDIKHQISILDEEIKTHSKTKKGFAKDEQAIYTQAFRETYHDLLEKAQSYIIHDFDIHSKAFEEVYNRYQNKIIKYRENPAFDDFIKENCHQIEKTINEWPTKGFKVFSDVLNYVRKIDDRLSDTRQTFIQQIKSELENEINQMINSIEQLKHLENQIDVRIFAKVKESSEKISSSLKFFQRTVDVVADDPHDKLLNDEKILIEATNMVSSAYDGTYGTIEEKLDNYVKKINLGKDSKKLIASINELKGNCKVPNNILDAITTIPSLLDFNKTMDLILKEIAVDIVDTQKKYIKKIKNINKYLGKVDAIEIPADNEIIQLEKVDLDDVKTLNSIETLLKKPLAKAAELLEDYEDDFSEGLGISINPNLKGKVERYIRPSYKPTIKQANKAMLELEKFAEELAKETGDVITQYVKDLKNFAVTTKALETFKDLLKNVGKDASSGKLTLSQITTKLEQTVKEYAKLLESDLQTHEEDLKPILKDEKVLSISTNLNLETFTLQHSNLINNISLDSVMTQKRKEEPKLLCKKCNAKIVWQKADYNDMLGLDVLNVRCENGHEDTLIGFGEEETKEEEKPIEIKCSKCGSETLIPIAIDIYSDKALTVTATCPKRHNTELTIKKL